jgi:hypothetical protein
LGRIDHGDRQQHVIMANNFQSELTQFLNHYKTDNPDTEARQRAGRFRLWDKDLDAEQQEGFRSARVPQDPYVYYQHD